MKYVIPLALVFLIKVNFISAAVLFVATDGNDSNPGSKFLPFRNIQIAIDNMNPGDTILVEPGLYNESIVIKGIKSDDSAPIYIRALGKVTLNKKDIKLNEGELAIAPLDMPISNPKHPYHPYFHGGIIRVEQSENVIIDGFEMVNSSWFGIAVYNSNDITIQNCITNNTGASGIYVLKSDNVKVLGNEVIRACAFPNRLPESGHGTQECISIVGCKYFEVAYNEVHEPGTYAINEDGGTGSGGEGIDAKEEGCQFGTIHHNYVYNIERGAIYCDAWNGQKYGDIDVYNNVIHDCKGGLAVAGEAGGKATNMRFYNNLIFNVDYVGFGLSSWGINGKKSNISFFNNTLYNCRGLGIKLGNQNHDSIFVYNNIAFGNGPSVEKKIDESEVAYEALSYKKVKKESSTGDFNPGDATNVFVEGNLFGIDPEFVDPTNLNFTLQEKSPAIDIHMGFDTPTLDLGNRPRKSGKKVDAGAYEYQPNK